jgi:NhaP-type Na+/H+ or K+/H+ antiporter
LSVKPRVAHVIISESALNDATGAICTMVVLGIVAGGTFSIPEIGIQFLWLTSVGAAMGVAAGVVAALLLDERLGVLRPLAGPVILADAVIAYTLAVMLGGSGVLAAFVAGVVVGNLGPFPATISELTRTRSREYATPTSLLLRGLLFIGLGDSLDLRSLADVAVPALACTAVLIFVARPIVVLVCAAPDLVSRWNLRELALFAWTRETGVVAGVLASLLLAQGVPSAAVISKLAAVAIIVTVVVQGTTTPWLVRRLGLLERRGPTLKPLVALKDGP